MENNNKGKSIVIIVLILIILGLVGYVSYIKFYGNNTNSNVENYTKGYYSLNDVKKEKITKEEFIARVKKYNATCGLIDQKDENGKAELCYETENSISSGDDYVAYIDNGTPYYMSHASVCDEDGACTTDDENYEVYNFSEIKNVKQIASKVDQYNGVEFAYELNNGDVYYFTPLFDDMVVDGVKHDTHLVKLELSSKLKKFSNVENGQITYGTEIVLELENNEKYVIEYNYETNKVSLTKYANYNKKSHEFDDSVELSTEEQAINLSSSVLESSYLNNIIENNKFISENYDDQDYDGICPEMTIDGNHFHVLQISNTKVFLYADNDNSDGRMIEVYGLNEDANTVYYAKFFAVDYEDPKNHSLALYTYSIENIDSIALIKATKSSDMLDGSDINSPYNYLIIKTKDGKYYTDYSYKNDTRLLRQVVQK